VGPYNVANTSQFEPEVGAKLNCRAPSGSSKWLCGVENAPAWCDCDSADQTQGASNPAKAEWRMLGYRPVLSSIW
jgi:hypothetical protein